MAADGYQRPVCYADVLSEIELEFGKFCVPDTLRNIFRRLPWCNTVKGNPKDAARVECDESTEAGYNVDEAGLHDWVDATKTRVIVPVAFPDAAIQFPVSRMDTRSTMIARIPGLAHKTADLELFEADFTRERCALRCQENGFCTAALFQQWCFDIFLPDTIESRPVLGYGGPVFLIMDGFTGHTTNAIEDSFLQYGIWMHPGREISLQRRNLKHPGWETH